MSLRSFLLRDRAFEHAEDVALFHDEKLLAVDLDLGARPFAEQHPLAGLHVERHKRALLVAGAGADGHDRALLRLLLRGIGDDDAAFGPLILLDTAHDDAVMQWTKLHLPPPPGNDVRGRSKPGAPRASYVDGHISTFKTRVPKPLAIGFACCQGADLICRNPGRDSVAGLAFGKRSRSGKAGTMGEWTAPSFARSTASR